MYLQNQEIRNFIKLILVALSKVTDISKLALLFNKDKEEEKTENMVFFEILLLNQQ